MGIDSDEKETSNLKTVGTTVSTTATDSALLKEKESKESSSNDNDTGNVNVDVNVNTNVNGNVDTLKPPNTLKVESQTRSQSQPVANGKESSQSVSSNVTNGENESENGDESGGSSNDNRSGRVKNRNTKLTDLFGHNRSVSTMSIKSLLSAKK